LQGSPIAEQLEQQQREDRQKLKREEEEGSEEEGSEESWKPVGEDDKGLRMERLDGKISCQLTHKG
jgi:hypothetical protein